MTTKQQQAENLELGLSILGSVADEIKSGRALVVITTEQGRGVTDYLRVSAYSTRENGEVTAWHLTYAVAKVLGYTLKDRGGYWHLAIGGGGYSKADEIARGLANFYGIERVRYDRG